MINLPTNLPFKYNNIYKLVLIYAILNHISACIMFTIAKYEYFEDDLAKPNNMFKMFDA